MLRRRSVLIAAAIVTILSPAPDARAYDVSITASNAGPVLTPWSGLIAGPTNVVSYTVEPGGRRTWTSEETMVVTPPIPEENWFPGPIAGRHAMYQLIQFVVDWIMSSYYPSDPTALGALTGYQFRDSTVVTNADHGILIVSGGTASSLPVPRFDGTIQASTLTTFSYCLNSYTVWGQVTPNGPGSAIASGWAVLPLEDGSDLVLSGSEIYTFDPTLTLPYAYGYEHHGSFELVAAEPQTWAIHSSYSEWPLDTASVEPVRSSWGRVRSLFRE
jgi:hypothetical protein